MPTRLRVRDKVMFGLLGCCGVAVAIVMFVITLQSEDKEAVSGFRSEWADCAASFLDYLRLRLLTARAVADAVGQYATLPSPNVTQLVMRSYGTILQTLSAVCILQRVPNNASVIREWEKATSARMGVNVTVTTSVFNVSPGKEFVWLVADTFYIDGRPGVVLGRDASSRPEVRAAIDRMNDGILAGSAPVPGADSLVPAFGNAVSVSELHLFSRPSTFGFDVFSTMQPNDMSQLVMVTSIIDSFMNASVSPTSNAVFRVTDHSGKSVERGGCAFSDRLSSFHNELSVTTRAVWVLTVGECPANRGRYVSWKRYGFLAITLLLTLLAMEVFRRTRRKYWLDNERMKTDAVQQLTAVIIGYLCHEVRNPLHVVRATFSALTAPLVEILDLFQSRTGTCYDIPGIGDVPTAIKDCQDAIAAMQGTVNDVLDLHAVARSEFKLDPAPVAVASAALRTLEHCRRFVNSDVKLQFTLPPANAHVVVDFPRVAQFVKDAILHAGALVPAKGIVDVAITVADSTPVTENSGYDCALIVTVSHTRFENVPFETPEAMFVPFRAGQSIVQHAQLERPVRLVLEKMWGASEMTQQQVTAATALWRAHRPTRLDILGRRVNPTQSDRNSGASGSFSPLTPSSVRETLPETGLGLPLCRLYAASGSGWAGLGDSKQLDADVIGLSTPSSRSNFSETEEVPPTAWAVSQLWLVMYGTRCVDAVDPSDRPYASEAEVKLGPLDSSLCLHIPSLESSLLLASPPVSDTERFQKLRVLFVDDESSNVRVGRRYLSMVGVNLHNVVTLSDGDSLWDALSDPSGSAEFDIALLDVMLPGRTSVDVLTALPVKPRCVCIAMTAGVDSVAVENLKSAGFHGILSKPFDKAQLEKCLHLALNSSVWFAT